MVQKVAELAKAKGCTPGQLALAWVHSRGSDVVPIPGVHAHPSPAGSQAARSAVGAPGAVPSLSAGAPASSLVQGAAAAASERGRAAGTKNPGRVGENLAAARIELSQQDLADLEAAVPLDQVWCDRVLG